MKFHTDENSNDSIRNNSNVFCIEIGNWANDVALLALTDLSNSN